MSFSRDLCLNSCQPQRLRVRSNYFLHRDVQTWSRMNLGSTKGSLLLKCLLGGFISSERRDGSRYCIQASPQKGVIFRR